MKMSVEFPRKYVVAADLNGKDVTLTIKKVVKEEMGQPGQKEFKPVVYFERATKGLILNATNARIIVSLYGDESDNWSGKPITLYPTTVKAFGKSNDVIRVRERAPAAPVAKSPTTSPTPPPTTSQPEPEQEFDDADDYLDDEGDGIPEDVEFTQDSLINDETMARNPFEDGTPYYKAAREGLSTDAQDLINFAMSLHRGSDGECTMADYKTLKGLIFPLCAKTRTQAVEILSILCQTEIKENNRVGKSLTSALLRYLSPNLADGQPNPEYTPKMAKAIREIAQHEPNRVKEPA